MPNLEAINDARYVERRFEALEAAINASPPTHGGALPTPASLLTTLSAKTVNSTQTTIAHLLGYTPKIYGFVMTSAGTVWRSATSDGTNIYLTADANSRTCDVIVGR